MVPVKASRTDLNSREAVFFLVTNTLIVFGQVAFDNAMAVVQSFPAIFPKAPAFLPSPLLLLEGLFLPTSRYDEVRLEGLRDALARLQKKSRSFYLASGVFPGRLRIDLVLL
jgi:15-cis-phytoene synthase/lycopene beta-cyclase